jgi:hypothetical protein
MLVRITGGAFIPKKTLSKYPDTMPKAIRGTDVAGVLTSVFR